MKQNRPSQPALLIHVLLIMVFAMGMFSIQPSVVVEAASIVAQPGAEKTTFLLPVDLVSTDSLASVGAAENPDAVPNFVVDPQYDRVEVYNWTPNSTIKLTVDGTLVAAADSNAAGYVSFGYMEPYFDIAAGQVVKVSGGGVTMKHIVAKFKVTAIDTLTNTITGKAAPGSEVIVGIPHFAMNFSLSKNVTTGADGVWQVDFTDTEDILPGQWIGVKQFDGNGNATYMDWCAPDPKLFIEYEKDEISGWGWWAGAKVALTIDSYKATTTVDKRGTFVFDLAGILDVQPGYEVSVSDGIITKQLIITNLTITAIDEEADTISGTADPDSSVEILAFAKDSEIGYFKYALVDSFGNWTADYSSIVEISSGAHGWVEQADVDGDYTHLDFIIPDRPLLTSLSKSFAVSGQPGMKLLANGKKFSRASSIWWGGMEIETTFISKNQLSFKLDQAKLAVSGDYFIRAVTQPGGVASSPLIFQVIETTPAYNGKLTSNYANFDWSDITGATGYKIQLSPKSDFSTLLVDTKTIVSNYDGYITPLPRGKTYYWRIKPLYGDVSGPWSVALPFNTQDPLDKPLLLIPTPNAIITNTDTPKLEWALVVNGVNYQVQISKLVDFSTKYFKATTSNTEFETNPLPNGKYYWRVRALDLDGIKGPWSEVRMFKIALP